MKKFLFIILCLLINNILLANEKLVSVSDVKVQKRNKPQCARLGNIYDSCQWMLKFKVHNKTNYNLISFCSVIKIDKKKYELCSNQKKNKYHTIAKGKTVVLTNLSELVGYENELPKPKVTFISIKAKFTKP